jgi:quinol-cytochrome oxidoreductase complex cytochrome b subunit
MGDGKSGLSNLPSCGESRVMSTAQHSHYRRRTRKNRLYVVGFVLLVVLVIGLVVGLLLLMNSPALDLSR